MTRALLLKEIDILKYKLKDKDSVIRDKDYIISDKECIIRELKDKIAILELLHFGPKSEKWTEQDELQARLFNEAEDEAFLQSDEEKQQAVIETQELGAYKRRKHNRNQGRKPISKDLPREEVVYDLSEQEKQCACGSEKTCIGAEITERVKIKPAEVTVLEEKKLKYACQNCEGIEADEPGVVTAKGIKHLIAGSLADESLLAWIATEKFEYALPFYRQAKRLSHIGIPLPRATLSNLMIRAAEESRALYNCLKDYIRCGPLINADETRIQVLKEPGRKAKDQSWMWIFRGGMIGKPGVIFQYDEKRSSKIPYEFLKDYEGWLQTDDYGAYHTALKNLNTSRKNKKRLRHILCWAHARSKFYKAWEVTKSEHAKTALEYIRELFAFENLRKDFSLQGFHKQRKSRADLIFNEFKPWLLELYASTPPKSILGKALAYTLDNWQQLILYVEDPFLTPSNNLAENAIRPFVIGRKNWLFAGTPKGAQSSAILYSLVESAKLSKLNPYDYLYYIFKKLPYAEIKQDYIDLLPFNLTSEQIKPEI